MKIHNAALDWREDGLPYSATYDDVYFSRDDAEGESQHVFLVANGLRERWQDAAPDSRFVIAELGFGSGLNFMQTAALWRAVSTPTARLHYLAFEKHPLTRDDLQRLHSLWPACQYSSEELLAQYPEHTAGCHRLQLAHNITLDLFYGDANTQLAAHSGIRNWRIDCWYLDGFNPKHNPQLWTETLFATMARLSADKATLSSYSVAGTVRRGLTAAGFKVEKRPGFGRKRELLFASRHRDDLTQGQTAPQAKQTTAPTNTANTTREPWWQLPTSERLSGHTVVIGAGLAGCSTAFSLARRGWRVTVVERQPHPAAAASGIKQLALRCRFFRQCTEATEFFTHAFLYTARHFRQLQDHSDIGWHESGVMQTASALNRSTALTFAELSSNYDNRLVNAVSQSQASELAGVALAADQWHLPNAGWIRPEALCKAYLSHPNITLLTEYEVQELSLDQNRQWQLHSADSAQSGLIADVVVIANSYSAQQFSQSNYLPLAQVRGQVTQCPVSRDSARLAQVVCGERSVFPASTELLAESVTAAHTIASSYSSINASELVTSEEDCRNLQLAALNFTEPGVITQTVSASQVAFRCNSSDRFPVIGQLANRPETVTRLAALDSKARHRFAADEVAPNAIYYPGLYVNIAHGSNGLATCPLGAELLASLIGNETLPCPDAAVQALNPMRFVIRELKKQQVEMQD